MQKNLGPKKKTQKKTPGFTLIEIIAVMAIIGVLTAALLPSIKTAMNKSQDTQKISALSVLDSGAKVYELEHGTKPNDIKDLVDGAYVPDKDYSLFQYDSANGDFTVEVSSGTTLHSKDLGKSSTEKQS